MESEIMQVNHKIINHWWAYCSIANCVYEKVVIKVRDDYKFEDMKEWKITVLIKI